MAVKREDFAEISDELWETIKDSLEKGVDRVRLQASETARKKAEDAAQAKANAEIERLAKEQAEAEIARMSMDEKQRLEADKQALEAEKQAFKLQAETFKVQQFLTEKGVPNPDKFAVSLAKLSEDDRAAFLDSYSTAVTTKVDNMKKELLANGSAPSTGKQIDASESREAKIQQLREEGDTRSIMELKFAKQA